MRYQAIMYRHDCGHKPVFIYSEVDASGRESRKVEMYRGGTYGMAGNGSQTGSTRLSEQRLPPLEETAKSDGISARPISEAQFEDVWHEALVAGSGAGDVKASFLRGIWQNVIPRPEREWVERAAAVERTADPLGDFGPLVKKMLDHGMTPEEVARFAQIVGYETAFGLLYHLDDSSASYDAMPNNAAEEHCWQLFSVDPETDEPIESVGGMHESLLSADPSGREMRPPG